MSRTTTPESGARSRTRRAILSAAASVLARDRTATLGDIADAADVGRTTLHRYFPDREGLVNAAIEDSARAIEQSVNEAALDQGSAREAMRRLVAALVEVGDRLMFLFGDPRALEGHGSAAAFGPDASTASRPESAAPAAGPAADPVIPLIERGQAEGVFDPEVSATWIQHVLWALVYTGCEEAAAGRLPRHGVTSTVIRTLESGITVRQ